jgi:hypothetical protein
MATAAEVLKAAAPVETGVVRTVQLDGQVVLKIMQHCDSALPNIVTGQLLGLDVGAMLEVTDCFPFPVRAGAGRRRRGRRRRCAAAPAAAAAPWLPMLGGSVQCGRRPRCSAAAQWASAGPPLPRSAPRARPLPPPA